MDRRKVSIIAVALLAAATIPANSAAQPDVPVESQLTQGVGAPIPPERSTGAITLQILQSIQHLPQLTIATDSINAPATASVQAERVSPPTTIALPLTVEETIREVWPDEIEDRAVRIAWRESRFVPTAHNSICFGIFQVYFSVHRAWLDDYGVYTPSDLYDPRVNATVALALYEQAGWSPWQT